MRFSKSAQNLQIKTNTKSTSTTTGALVVTGGAGFTDNVYVGGNLTSGNLSATAIAGTISTAAQPNITSLGTLVTNLALSSGSWVQSNTPGSGNVNLNDTNRIIRSVASGFAFNLGSTDTVLLDMANTFPQITSIGINVNVTLSYSGTITQGYVRYSAIQNLSGATRQIILPNSNNNKGTNTIIIANGITASFTFTAFDSTAANVVVFIANN